MEAVGAAFRFDGVRVRVWYPGQQQREELVRHIAFLRAHKEDATRFLRARAVIPAMPPGVRLIAWNLKEPPVAIESCAVVTDSALFARTTLDQLRRVLAQPKHWVGWSAPQLMDRLTQVGVIVALESKGKAAAAT